MRYIIILSIALLSIACAGPGYVRQSVSDHCVQVIGSRIPRCTIMPVIAEGRALQAELERQARTQAQGPAAGIR